MGQFRKGHERVLYYGTYGSRANASTLLDGAVNIDIKPEVEFVDRVNRGDGTTLPQADEAPVAEKVMVTFSITYKNGHAPTEAMLAAASAKTLKAFKSLPYIGSSRIEIDGDAYVALTNNPGQIKDGQVLEFELHFSSDGGGRSGKVYLYETT